MRYEYSNCYVERNKISPVGRNDNTVYTITMHLYQKEVFRMIYYRTYSEADAEDLTQEVFISMLKGLKKLKDPEKFRGWLFRVALNKVRDHKRKERFLSIFGTREKEAAERIAAPFGDPAETAEGKQFIRSLRLFVSKLPDSEREVFLLRFVDRLGIKEISLALEKGESTVKTHLYRALQKFRNHKEVLDLLGEEGLP